jgi:RNA polymerase sigma-70 factor (ECF subfamily)
MSGPESGAFRPFADTRRSLRLGFLRSGLNRLTTHNRLLRLRPQLLAYARAVCGSYDEAEDLVHDAVERALTAHNVPGSIEELRPWMFRVLRNLNIDRQRKIRVRTEYAAQHKRLLDDAPVIGNDPLRSLLLRQALEGLTAEHREVVFLVDIMGLRYAEAASVLDVPEGTIMSRISRARQALFDGLDESNVAPMPKRQRRN